MLEVLSRAQFERDVGRLKPRLLTHRKWTVLTNDYPVFDVLFGHATAEPLRLRFECTDWDDVPPSIQLLHANGAPWVGAPPNVGSVFNSGGHPATGHPFVCMRGVREFHTHPSHLTEPWDGYRSQPGMDLLGILNQLWRAWKRAVG